MSLPRSSAAPWTAYPASRTAVPSSQTGTASSRTRPPTPSIASPRRARANCPRCCSAAANAKQIAASTARNAATGGDLPESRGGRVVCSRSLHDGHVAPPCQRRRSDVDAEVDDQDVTVLADSLGVWAFGQRRLSALIVVAAVVVPASSARAASVDVAEGFPRTATPGELIEVTAQLDGVGRCTFQVGRRVATVGVAGASEVSFGFRVARHARTGSIRLVLMCSPVATKHATLRVRSSRGRGSRS